MKWAMIIGVVLLVLAVGVFVWVGGAIYLAYTNPTGTEFGPFMVLMTLPITLATVLAWMGVRLLGHKPPA
jgi:hypothetical protein